MIEAPIEWSNFKPLQTIGSIHLQEALQLCSSFSERPSARATPSGNTKAGGPPCDALGDFSADG